MKRDKTWSKKIGQALTDNLNRNVSLEHVEEVEKGLKPADEEYYFIKKNIKHYKTFDTYMKWKDKKEYKKDKQ